MINKTTTLPPELLNRARASLKDNVKQDGNGETNEQVVGRAFEAMLVRHMVRAMQKTVPESSLLPQNSSSGIYEHFIEDAMVEQMARGGGVGIAESLSNAGTPRRDAAPSTTGPLPQDIRKRASWSTGATMGRDSVHRTGPLAAQLPPQDDPWIDSPQAELHLRQLLKHGIDPSKVTP
jgi:Rod binding domain-containing protein